MKRIRWRWLVEGWFQRPKVGALESFLMRFFLALIVLFGMRGSLEGYTAEPNPVGLLRWLHQVNPDRLWLTWLADPATYDTWVLVMSGLLCAYVAGVGLPLVLPALALMHVLPFTLYSSQGFPHHGNQIISLLLIVQSGTVLWQAFEERRWNLGPPDDKLRGRLLWQSVMLIAATYFLSVLTKMIVSKGLWLWKADNFALDMIKTQRQAYLNRFDPARSGVPDSALWMLAHPWSARLVFGSGLILETLCILAIGNRLIGLVVGVSYLVMHRSIDALMGGVAFPYNELLVIVFFVGLPFGIAWLLEKVLPAAMRWGLVLGIIAGVPLSWLAQPATRHIPTLGAYLQALVNFLGVWDSQKWGDLGEFIWPELFLFCAAAGIVGAALGCWVNRSRLGAAAAV